MKHFLLSALLVLGSTLAVSAGNIKLAGKGEARVFMPGQPSTGMTAGKPVTANSKLGLKAVLKAQQAVQLPWTVNFATTDLSDFTVIDANEDDNTWGYNTGNANSGYSPKEEMDDWLITPPLAVTGGHAYTVRFKAAAYASVYDEQLEVMFGDAATVDAMTSTVMETTVVSGTDYKEYTGVVVPRTTGAVYIGFHCNSQADMNGLLISEISVTDGATGEMPAGVKDLTITADDPYSLRAHIAFEAPTTTMSGQALQSIDKITVSRNGDLVKTFENPQPGEALGFDDTVETGGDQLYTVIASNQAGAGYAINYIYTIGGIAPMYPDNVVLRELSDGMMQVTWDPVTLDVEGNVIPEGFIRYAVLDSEMILIASDLTETSLTFSLSNQEQIFVQLIVVAYNSVGGLSEGVMSNLIAAGPALTRFSESFPNASLSSLIAMGYEFGFVDYVTWGIADNTTFSDEDYMESILASDGDNGFAFMYTEYKDTGSSLFTGKIALPAVGPAVYFDIFNQSLETIKDGNLLEVMVSEDNGFTWQTVMAETVYDLCGDKRGWHHITAGLQDYAGKTVQIRWQVTVQNFPAFLIDNIKVGTLPDNDLKVWKLDVPAKVAAGEQLTATATVVNMGAREAADYTMTLYVNGEVEKEIAGETLAAGKTRVVSLPLAVSPVEDGPLEIYVAVKLDKDADKTNNATRALTVEVEQPVHPYVTDLQGSINADGMVSLSWSKPVIQTYAPGCTEDFESGEDFAFEFGDWIFIDRDQNPLGQLYPSTIPGVEMGVTKAAFMVFSADAPTFNDNMYAHSGKKYIASVVSSEPWQTTDDWAITPELNGTDQIITFYARSLEAYYAESIEMYFSYGSTNPDDFIKISSEDRVPGTWTQYTVAVPAGAKRFAVRAHSYDAMALLLDDFYFADANSSTGIELEKYNIYCNNKAVGSVEPTVTSFSHQSVERVNTYAVTAVYRELGESKGSNKLELLNESVGIEAVSGDAAGTIRGGEGAVVLSDFADGDSYVITNVAGMTVSGGRITAAGAIVPVAPGLYIVKCAGHTAKVVVK